MRINAIKLLVIATLLPYSIAAQAGIRAILDIEVIKGENVEKYAEIVTFDEDRFRIDFVGEDKKVTKETPYIMTTDGGDTWVMGDKPKDRFYCTSMKTSEFFKVVGDKVSGAIDFFNVKAETPEVTKNFEQPGPEMHGLKTNHVQIETNANAYAWFLFFKFEYSAKVTEDIWYTPDVDLHPVRKKWLNAITQSGNSIIDQYTNDYLSKLPGPVLKRKSVTEITDERKKKTKIQEERASYTEVTEVSSEELDKVFVMPKCEMMDENEVEEKAKALFSAGRIML